MREISQKSYDAHHESAVVPRWLYESEQEKVAKLRIEVEKLKAEIKEREILYRMREKKIFGVDY